METMNFEHEPVLLWQCIENLNIRPDGVYMDGTAGGAGHSSRIAQRLTEGGRLYSVDKDEDAIRTATARLAQYSCAEVLRGDYKDAKMLLADKTDHLDGALLDLGVSSFQLDCAERGFSYNREGALDMRMADNGTTAADIVNTASFEQLCRILRDYGEESYAPRIADKIIAAREEAPIETTLQLSEIVASALPASVRRKEKHPARKTFQALRIAVNDEMGALREGMESIFSMLKPGGRFCIITFHSIEDRIVKQYFASLQQGCTCPPEFPVCVCGGQPKAKAISKKPIAADEAECAENRRARSAKLRVIEKL